VVGAQAETFDNGSDDFFIQLVVWLGELHDDKYLAGSTLDGEVIEFDLDSPQRGRPVHLLEVYQGRAAKPAHYQLKLGFSGQ
jgi:hypothetical protein